MTRRLGLYSFACILLVAGCDGWGYSEEVKNNYVKSCNATGTDIMRKVCECSFEELKRSMPYKEFKAMDDAVKNNSVPEAASLGAVADAMKACSQKLFLSDGKGKNDKGGK